MLLAADFDHSYYYIIFTTIFTAIQGAGRSVAGGGLRQQLRAENISARGRGGARLVLGWQVSVFVLLY